MAIKPFEESVDIIAALGDNPGADNNLSAQELKAKFDLAANLLKDYINNHLIAELDQLIDVDALLKDILDTTLSKKDKAANAESTGAAIGKVRSDFAAIIKNGGFILNRGSKFALEKTGSRTYSVADGVCVILGNVLSMDAGTVSVEQGTAGLKRNDLIVLRYERSSLSYAALTGTNTSGTPEDPIPTQTDINSGGTVYELPLYRIRFNGTAIEGADTLLTPVGELGRDRILATAAIPTLWTGEAPPYTQTVALPGILESDTPHITPVYSEALETALTQKEGWSMISAARSGENQLTFTCLEEKPAVEIPIQVEVIR